MDNLAIQDEIVIESRLYSYQTLNKWLSWEGYSVFIWGGGFFMPVGIIGWIAFGAAIVFIPVMIRELIAVKKRGWIVAWIVMVAIPTGLIYAFGPENHHLLITAFVFLPASYVYFWILKMAVDTWIGQLSGQLELLRSRPISPE